jgi:hypothetical protein
VNATGEIILNITKYITIGSEGEFLDWQAYKTNSNNNVPDAYMLRPDDRADTRGRRVFLPTVNAFFNTKNCS